ncbi:hypothetical protein ABZS64_34285, partial [Streptomyces sp. NPDC005408]
PLRLAKYGVPLAETAPAGLAAAGVEPVLLPPVPQMSVERLDANPDVAASLPGPERSSDTGPAFEDGRGPEAGPWFTSMSKARPHRQGDASEAAGHDGLQYKQESDPAATRDDPAADTDGLGDAVGGELPQSSAEDTYFQGFAQFVDEYGMVPNEGQLGPYMATLYGPFGPIGGWLTEGELGHILPHFVQRYEAERLNAPQLTTLLPKQAARVEEVSAGLDAPDQVGEAPVVPPAPEPARQDEQVPIPPPGGAADPTVGDLTTVDRYYVAWMTYQQQHDREPSDGELSQFLAAQGIGVRGGDPVNPSTLRRYFLPFRIYAQWGRQRSEHESPRIDLLLKELGELGVKGQYGRPITSEFVEKLLPDFERRWRTFAAVWSVTPA